jgi:hypothetical protein
MDAILSQQSNHASNSLKPRWLDAFEYGSSADYCYHPASPTSHPAPAAQPSTPAAAVNGATAPTAAAAAAATAATAAAAAGDGDLSAAAADGCVWGVDGTALYTFNGGASRDDARLHEPQGAVLPVRRPGPQIGVLPA